jgi:hypothetical protein
MSSVIIAGDTSGSVTLSAPAVSGTTTLTLPTTSGTIALTAAPTFTGQATIPTINLTGGQITFPATAVPSADANTLDDYEEGSFTPAWGASTTAPTVTYVVQQGYYTKIGNIVNVIIGLVNASKSGGSGDLTITGLPFVPGGGGSLNALGGSIISFTTGWAGTASLSAFIQSGNSNMLLYVANNSTTRNTTADLGAGTYMYIHATYRTA